MQDVPEKVAGIAVKTRKDYSIVRIGEDNHEMLPNKYDRLQDKQESLWSRQDRLQDHQHRLQEKQEMLLEEALALKAKESPYSHPLILVME